MTHSNRPTFSIRDLLVFTAVIAMGAGLLSMALALRKDDSIGRNTQCKNNLNQLSKAIDSYENRRGQYPGYQQQLAGRTVPWPVEILPEVERLDLHEDWTDPNITKPAHPFLEIFVCPNDPPDTIGGPHLSYVANAGIADVDHNNFANGVFMDYAAGDNVTLLSSDDLIDGKSQTLLLSENVQATSWIKPGKEDTVFVWHATTTPVERMRINGGNLDLPLNSVTARPSSRHRGGVNVAFADTHVQFLSEEIDYHVYMQLMTSNGPKSDMPAAYKSFVLTEDDFK